MVVITQSGCPAELIAHQPRADKRKAQEGKAEGGRKEGERGE